MAIVNFASAPSAGASETGALPSRAKTAVLTMAMGFGTLCLASAGYLTMIELAVLTSLWLQEDRLFDASRPVTRPMVPAQGVHARYPRCQGDMGAALAVGDFTTLDAARHRCVEAIENALRWLPASPELWLHQARLLAEAGAPNEDFDRSLRLTYEFGTREGWLAPYRLKFGLLRWDVLPGDLRASVEADAWTMLQSWLLMKRLARLHWENPVLRQHLDEVVGRQATPNQKSTLYWLVEKLATGEPLP